MTISKKTSAAPTYPSGPSYDIGISDAHGQPLSTLTGLAATHHVVLARVSYEPDGHGTNRRVISIFGALDGNGMHANSPYPDYGFGPRTRVQRGDRFTDPLGRWLLYGSPRDTASVAKSIRRQGFELNRATPIGITQITKQFFSNSIAQVIFAGLAVVFVSGALSVSTASRVCAIQALHGMRTTGIIMRQFLRHAFFFIICVCIGWMTWISIGAIFWPLASPLGFAGQVFLSIIIATTCMALVALSLSIALVRVLVPNALKLIQGKRPLRFLMASGCIMAIIVLALSSASLNVTNFKWRQSQTLKTTLEHQLSSNDGFQLQLWYSSDQNRARSMPSWNDFVEQTSQSEHTRFASFRLGCTWVDSSQDPQPCILMDSRTARLHHLIRNNTTLARISVIMPENEQWDSESITNNVLRAYSFEQSLAAEEGKSLPAINRTSISIESRPRDAVLSAFDTPSNTDGLSSVPVVVIDPSLLSGDTTTSMVSTGGMTFDYSSRHQLLEILREKGVDSLVASVVNRHDEIQTRLARTTQEMNYFFHHSLHIHNMSAGRRNHGGFDTMHTPTSNYVRGIYAWSAVISPFSIDTVPSSGVMQCISSDPVAHRRLQRRFHDLGFLTIHRRFAGNHSALRFAAARRQYQTSLIAIHKPVSAITYHVRNIKHERLIDHA